MSVTALDRILVVDDDDDDALLTTRAVWRALALLNLPALAVERASDGREALDKLFDSRGELRSPRPKLVLLDLFMPRMDGHQFLSECRGRERGSIVPIVCLTTSDNAVDVEGAWKEGANGYLVKAAKQTEMVESLRALLDFWLNHNRLP